MTNFEIVSKMKSDIASKLEQVDEIMTNYKMGLITQRECYKQLGSVSAECMNITSRASEELDIPGNKSQFMNQLTASGLIDHIL